MMLILIISLNFLKIVKNYTMKKNHITYTFILSNVEVDPFVFILNNAIG